MMKSNSAAAFRIVLIYALLSAFYILVSDKLVVSLVTSRSLIATISIIKGWLYIAVISFLLYGLFKKTLDELQQANDAQNEARELLRAIIKSSPVSILTLSSEGLIKSWNPAAEQTFGWTEEEVIGKRLPFLNEMVQDEHVNLFQRVQSEVIRYDKGGTPLTLNLNAAPLMDMSGKIVGIVSLMVDITQNKKLNEQMLQANKLDSIGRLAGGIAHDLNNLLTVILGYAELANNQAAQSSNLKSSLENIQKAGNRAAELTGQLLAFARKQIVLSKVYEINEIVKDISQVLENIVGKDIKISYSLSQDAGNVKVDFGQIQQVLVNMTINARDAMPEGGELSIETSRITADDEYARLHMDMPAGDYVLLSVSDTGKGMPPEVRRCIFEPFYTTKEIGKGTGLGLSTCYGIIRQFQGNILVYSEPERGSVFKIYLPRSTEECEPQNVSENCLTSRGQERVLFVEDEPMLREIGTETLRREGYTIFSAASGEEAVDVACQQKYQIDILVTDLVMPGMGGQKLAQQLLSLKPDIRVLFTSGYTDVEMDEIIAENDRMAFLQKPYTPQALNRKMRELLDTGMQ
jgi:PAS domain S-box-containing protein